MSGRYPHHHRGTASGRVQKPQSQARTTAQVQRENQALQAQNLYLQQLLHQNQQNIQQPQQTQHPYSLPQQTFAAAAQLQASLQPAQTQEYWYPAPEEAAAQGLGGAFSQPVAAAQVQAQSQSYNPTPQPSVSPVGASSVQAQPEWYQKQKKRNVGLNACLRCTASKKKCERTGDGEACDRCVRERLECENKPEKRFNKGRIQDLKGARDFVVRGVTSQINFFRSQFTPGNDNGDLTLRLPWIEEADGVLNSKKHTKEGLRTAKARLVSKSVRLPMILRQLQDQFNAGSFFFEPSSDYGLQVQEVKPGVRALVVLCPAQTQFDLSGKVHVEALLRALQNVVVNDESLRDLSRTAAKELLSKQDAEVIENYYKNGMENPGVKWSAAPSSSPASQPEEAATEPAHLHQQPQIQHGLALSAGPSDMAQAIPQGSFQASPQASIAATLQVPFSPSEDAELAGYFDPENTANPFNNIDPLLQQPVNPVSVPEAPVEPMDISQEPQVNALDFDFESRSSRRNIDWDLPQPTNTVPVPDTPVEPMDISQEPQVNDLGMNDPQSWTAFTTVLDEQATPESEVSPVAGDIASNAGEVAGEIIWTGQAAQDVLMTQMEEDEAEQAEEAAPAPNFMLAAGDIDPVTGEVIAPPPIPLPTRPQAAPQEASAAPLIPLPSVPQPAPQEASTAPTPQDSGISSTMLAFYEATYARLATEGEEPATNPFTAKSPFESDLDQGAIEFDFEQFANPETSSHDFSTMF